MKVSTWFKADQKALLALLFGLGLFTIAPGVQAADGDETADADAAEWEEPKPRRTRKIGQVIAGFAGSSYSTGDTACDYYGYYCTSSQEFDLKSTFAPKIGIHFFPVRHFQIGLDGDFPKIRTTTIVTVYPPGGGAAYDQEQDLGKLKLRRLGLTAAYRAPGRKLDFYLGGGFDFYTTDFETDGVWTANGDRIDADTDGGFHLTLGVDIKLSKDVYFNIEGVGRSYDTTLTYKALGPATPNTGLKLYEKVTDASLGFGIGFRF